MSVIKLIIYFISGLLLIGGAACLGIGFFNGSIQAFGGAIMFLCFGSAGVMLGVYLDTVLNLFKHDQRVT